MSQQKDEDFLKSLPPPKASVITYVRQSLPVEVGRIVNECLAAIREYNLEELVGKAKSPSSFRDLADSEKELLCAGLIKLGEALTFCRDRGNRELASTGIIPHAVACAAARNHFVHHHMYHTHLRVHSKAQECIDNLLLINILQEKLQALQGCGLEVLTKPIRKGQNDFPFEYADYVRCLKAEFLGLQNILRIGNILDQLRSDITLRAALENRIRNILSIMVDLTDIEFLNKNNDNQCIEQKKATQKINQSFIREHGEYVEFFRDVKEFRNSLCHLDDTLSRPYINIESMFAFAEKLLNMKELGYINKLGEQFLPEREIESATQAVVSADTQANTASSSSSSAPQAPSSQSDEGKRKVKVIATSATQTAKSAAAAAATPSASSASVFRLLPPVYNSDSDEESKKDSKDQTQSSSPRMGGGKR